MTGNARTRAQRAARLRAIEGVPEGECLAEMGHRCADCDCDICAQQHEQPAAYPGLEDDE